MLTSGSIYSKHLPMPEEYDKGGTRRYPLPLQVLDEADNIHPISASS
jgi:hypothetical protein